MRIAVYQDYVQNNGSLLFALQERDIDYRLVNADDIIAGVLGSFDALIMPGGADLYYCEKLNGAGNAAIRAFIEQGGGYLGICAGSYYGCTQLNWNNGDIAGTRELGLITTMAKGPVLSFMEDSDINKSWYGAVELDWNGQRFKTLYAAGPVFENPDADIIARYTALDAPAVIGRTIGKGRVILSSPHIEVSAMHFTAGRYQHRNASHAHEMAVARSLEADGPVQKSFLNFILGQLV